MCWRAPALSTSSSVLATALWKLDSVSTGITTPRVTGLTLPFSLSFTLYSLPNGRVKPSARLTLSFGGGSGDDGVFCSLRGPTDRLDLEGGLLEAADPLERAFSPLQQRERLGGFRLHSEI